MNETIDINSEMAPAAAVPTPEPDAPAAATTPAPDYRFSRRIVTLSRPDSPEAEGIRSLHTHLMAGHVRDGRRGLAICSPGVGAGCTTVSVNLAVAFAQAGINTLLVDANLHQPGVEQMIQPFTPATGLQQLLTSDSEMQTDEVRHEILPNLSVLYAGGQDARASQLIATRQFKQVIDDCMRDFEFTIVDTPAHGGSTDARRVALSVRYALIVARRNVTYLSEVKDFIEQLETDRIRLVGSFLTDF
ncbi:CpsD/CapB family tyrosine-protein kinase [Sphingomonas turrisvirgatae]|uniref:non-specific protein-tyrosine kinase n=1 Tax=Sphingomonas turrisvirgatae TaxID=1888892 RepID=A0A1E3LRT3_9SPHN|nr:CpsD/CapB family tyrosine-protein kinase [Sphingomonas turrisvirgatae]ODP36467.1 hypothetical protein BFL28_05620 [Sphingomonas turrisvirgatae]